MPKQPSTLHVIRAMLRHKADMERAAQKRREYFRTLRAEPHRLTLQQIADEYGCSRQFVHKELKG